jgi:hypothetical protein
MAENKNEAYLIKINRYEMELAAASYWAILYAFLSSILINLICFGIIYWYTRQRAAVTPAEAAAVEVTPAEAIDGIHV